MTLHKVSICYGMYKWGRAPRRRYHCMAVSLRGPAVAAGRPRAGGGGGRGARPRERRGAAVRARGGSWSCGGGTDRRAQLQCT